MLTTPKAVLNVGILNIMTDKQATYDQFNEVLNASDFAVNLINFYPTTHKAKHPLPAALMAAAQPLEQLACCQLDAFIISGAPLDHLAFEQIDYYQELTTALATLKKRRIPRLFSCWGAMAAAHYYYGVKKSALPEKLFGVYPHQKLSNDRLIKALPANFVAPHARYQEPTITALQAAKLAVLATTADGRHPFAARAKEDNAVYLFAHLEYDRMGLKAEYLRECSAKKSAQIAENYYDATGTPTFLWQAVRQQFFANWLQEVVSLSRCLAS